MRWASAALTCVFASCVAGLIAVVVLPPAEPSASYASDAADLAFSPHPGAQLPLDARVMDKDGQTSPLGRYFGKSPVILVLEYLRCRSLCSVTLQNLIVDDLNRLPLEAGTAYQLVAISIDPRDKSADCAAAWSKYVRMLARGEASGLHFLTAAPNTVREIADAVGFHYRYDAFLDAYIHPAGFVVAAPDGVISRYVEGVAISPRQLLDDFDAARQDKSQGLVARIFLLCHVQGAPLGRYTIPVTAALMLANLAAGFSLIALFAAIRRRG